MVILLFELGHFIFPAYEEVLFLHQYLHNFEWNFVDVRSYPLHFQPFASLYIILSVAEYGLHFFSFNHREQKFILMHLI